MKADDSFLREAYGGCTIALKVIPKSPQNMVFGIENGELKLKIQAPPVESAANEAVVQFLAKLLDRPKIALEIIMGKQSRHKVVRIQGLKPTQVLAVLEKQINKRMRNG